MFTRAFFSEAVRDFHTSNDFNESMIWFRGEAANARVGGATTPQRSRPQDSPPDPETSAGAPSSVAPMSQETSQFGVRRRVAMETFNRRNYVDSFGEYCERRAKENADVGLVHLAAMMAASAKPKRTRAPATTARR